MRQLISPLGLWMGLACAGMAASEENHGVAVAVRVDCTQDSRASSQAASPCVRLSGLRFGLEHRADAQVSARLRVDLVRTASSSLANHPIAHTWSTETREQSTAAKVQALGLHILDDYGITWTPRTNFEIALEHFYGTVDLANLSLLPQGAYFTDPGLSQTAATLRYKLDVLNGLEVKFAGGNGEGERLVNRDPQQYIGFGAGLQIFEGLRAVGGISFDGNHAGSDEAFAQDPPPSPALRGFSTRRIAAALQLDGNLASARGLMASIGWHAATAIDLDRATNFLSTDAASFRADPRHAVFEGTDPNVANTVVRRVLVGNLSYRILDKYFLGASIERWTIDAGSAAPFSVCSTFASGEEGPRCTGTSKGPFATAAATHLAFGVGGEWAPSLRFVLDVGHTAYDELYNVFYFGDTTPMAKRDVVNFRVAYNWP